MKHFSKFLYVAIFILVASTASAEFTSQQATNLVLNQILSSEIGNVDVFMFENTRSNQLPLYLTNGDSIVLPYTSNWVYFVDDKPFTNWAHSCRYIFVDEATGVYQVVSKDFYPVDWKSSYSTVSEMPRPDVVDLPVNQNANINGLPANTHQYAVIICGVDNDQRYWNDISATYCTLLNVYGFTKENIFVFYAYGTSQFGDDLDGGLYSDDIDHYANRNRILETFTDMAGGTDLWPDVPVLGPDDELFIFVDGEGYIQESSYLICNGATIADYEMAEALEGINCGQIIAVFEPSMMIGFEEQLSDYVSFNVSCKNRSIQTASDDGSSSAEVWITGGKYGEFVYYWTAAVRGHYPLNNEPWTLSEYAVGTFPFYDYPEMVGHPNDYDPDLNGDGFVQMEEAFSYANNWDTWSSVGYFFPYNTFTWETPQNFIDISFQEDLLSIIGLTGHVENTQTVDNRNYTIGAEFIIDLGKNLTFEDGSGLYLNNSTSQINVNPFAVLNTGNGMEIYGGEPNKITINGNIYFGTGVIIDRIIGSYSFGGLFLNNQGAAVTLNDFTFNHGQLINYSASLNIDESDISNTYLGSHRGIVSIDRSTFDAVWTYFSNSTSPLSSFSLTVTNSTFKNGAYAGLTIDGYNYFNINNNQIFNCTDGIVLSNSGNGLAGNQNIMSNEINNNSSTGISIYNSKVSVSSNYIYNNRFGIRIFNNSNTALYGNPGATTYNETNYITDNSSYEMYASTYSFPWYFRYNAIIDEDNLGNPTDPMVYYQPSGGGSLLIDVRYNCWGNNFSQTADLYPAGYMVDPTWCPPGGGHKSTEIALDDFLEGLDYFENEQYADAKTTFQSVINLYPETPYAESAMHELFSLEKFADNDYSTLQQYYETNNSIQADTVLTKLATFLSNKCEIELQNWQTAIDHYEDIIENPETPEDSIFAIIDLGYTYLLMGDSGYKSTAQGRLLEHKPASPEAFSTKRDYLLSLLPFGKSSSTSETPIGMSKQGELLQNVPNPFTYKTNIQFNLNSSELSCVEIRIYDQIGKEVVQIQVNSVHEGLNTIEFSAKGFPVGIYYYSLLINGVRSDTKKLMVQ